jgi:hypothetical protein
MLQRIQTIYLIAAALLSGVLVFLCSFWTLDETKTIGILETFLDDVFL